MSSVSAEGMEQDNFTKEALVLSTQLSQREMRAKRETLERRGYTKLHIKYENAYENCFVIYENL